MEKQMITLTVDEQEIKVPPGTTIMQAAEQIGIRIPRLCFHPDLSLSSSCRVCIVEVEGMSHYMTSCAVPVWEGMVIRTNSPEIRQARRDIVELLLDNHPVECQLCERDGNCELQRLAYTLGVRKRHFEGERKNFPMDISSLSVVRVPNKCILCGRCVRVCNEVQGVHNLSQHGRGFHTVVTPAHGSRMDDSVCIQCGQCINVCPTAALLEKRHTGEVWQALADPTKHVVVQTAPSIRAAIGEGFGMNPGTPATAQMITGLRRLGFDEVFDTNFAADLTIIEESHEFLQRLQNGGPLPMITSCSPGWINFLEKFYPQLIPNTSTCRSPMTMLSVLIKTYYAEKMGMDPKQIFVVAVMPCVAKKYEAGRGDHCMEDRTPYTDAVLTTREIIWMLKSYGIDLPHLPPGRFDTPLGISTGAADIFGTTGGVMEATLRTATYRLTGKTVEDLDFKEVRAVEGQRVASIAIGDKNINVGVANGLQNAKVLLDQVVNKEKNFHILEIMACPGGCIGGGGQPYPPTGSKVLDPELLRQRASVLYSIDGGKQLRISHENPSIDILYKEYLEQPGSEKAYALLHTHYQARLPRGIR